MNPDAGAALETLTAVVRQVVRGAGYRRGIVALTGRVDEIVVAAVAARALRAEQVRLLLVVDPEAGEDALTRARAGADHLGIESETISLAPFLDALLDAAPEANEARRHGFLSRIRTTLLHDRSLSLRALVLGAASKSDMLLGQITRYGEDCGAVNPIGDLYATEVVAMAEELGIPEEVVGPPPVVDLPAGSSHGGKFEPNHAWIDPLLRLLVDGRVRPRELAERGYERADIQRVAGAVRRNAHKRRLPIVPVLTDRPPTG